MGKLPYSAHNSRGQQLGEKVDGDAVIQNELIKVFGQMGIMFEIHNTPFDDMDEEWTLNKLRDIFIKKVKEKTGKKEIKYCPLIYVICDSFLSGVIYQTGNYPEEDCFRVYAITQGMA